MAHVRRVSLALLLGGFLGLCLTAVLLSVEWVVVAAGAYVTGSGAWFALVHVRESTQVRTAQRNLLVRQAETRERGVATSEAIGRCEALLAQIREADAAGRREATTLASDVGVVAAGVVDLGSDVAALSERLAQVSHALRQLDSGQREGRSLLRAIETSAADRDQRAEDRLTARTIEITRSAGLLRDEAVAVLARATQAAQERSQSATSSAAVDHRRVLTGLRADLAAESDRRRTAHHQTVEMLRESIAVLALDGTQPDDARADAADV